MTSWTMPTLRRGAASASMRASCRQALESASRAALPADTGPVVRMLAAAGVDADSGQWIGMRVLDETLVDAFTGLWTSRGCAEFAYNLAAEVTGDVVRGTGDGTRATAAADLLLFTARTYLDLISDPEGAWALPEEAIDAAWERLSVGCATAEEVPLDAPHGATAALIAAGADLVTALTAGIVLLRWCLRHSTPATL